MIIENIAHPDYRPELMDYLERAEKACGYSQTPHILKEAFDFHQRLADNKSMKKQ